MALQFPSSHSSIPQLNTLVGLYVILHFLLYSSVIHVSSTSTSIISTTSPLIIKKGNEALALITWKSSLDIHSQSFLSSWSRASPCNHWFGVTCHKSGSISNLNHHNCGLRGTLHNLNFLAFSDLLALNLRNNSFYGTIPIHIGNISKLITFLVLGLNNFNGLIPHQVGSLTSLIFLILDSNHLSGSIPSSI